MERLRNDSGEVAERRRTIVLQSNGLKKVTERMRRRMVCVEKEVSRSEKTRVHHEVHPGEGEGKKSPDDQ